MSDVTLKALTSFAGREGRIQEGETFEATETRATELVRLKLATRVAESQSEPAKAPAPEKEGKEPSKTKEDKTDLKTK
jgi:hypothetical protein